MEEFDEKNRPMPNPKWIAKTKPDCLAGANLILARSTAKVKATVACIKELILTDKFHLQSKYCIMLSSDALS